MNWVTEAKERKLSEEQKAREEEMYRLEHLPARIARAHGAFRRIVAQLAEDTKTFNSVTRSNKRFYLRGHTVFERGTGLLALYRHRCFSLELHCADPNFRVGIRYPNGHVDHVSINTSVETEPFFWTKPEDDVRRFTTEAFSSTLLWKYFHQLL